MVSLQKIKRIVRGTGGKAGEKAVKKIDLILEEKAKEIARKAKRKADFSGRSIIKEEDIQDENV